jgi:hypothetical protein
MTSEGSKPKRAMPKGGRKGGAVFPRIPLADALAYAKKLVSKTHVGPQPVDVIHSGVVGVKGGIGDVRISALKQYGFIEGDKKNGFSASELAKKIASAPSEEILPFHQKAALLPAVFKAIFDTYHGDVVSRARLKQRAAGLKVHPDQTETCIEIYVSSLELAKLVTVEGDQVRHLGASNIAAELALEVSEDASTETPTEEPAENVAGDDSEGNDGTAKDTTASVKPNPEKDKEVTKPRAVFNVNVTLDSSLDIEKLAKQLELLKRFGAI